MAGTISERLPAQKSRPNIKKNNFEFRQGSRSVSRPFYKRHQAMFSRLGL
jgi:hypothetical protein